jgi:hypothetical protein
MIIEAWPFGCVAPIAVHCLAALSSAPKCCFAISLEYFSLLGFLIPFLTHYFPSDRVFLALKTAIGSSTNNQPKMAPAANTRAV